MNEVRHILKETKLKKGQVFYDLGCGDGRVVRTAVQEYGVKGVGVDINPLLIWVSLIKARLADLKNIHFRRENIFSSDLSDADVVYLFLMPELLAKLKKKLVSELKPKTIILSHGFKIEGWDNYLTRTVHHLPFPTYFYVLK